MGDIKETYHYDEMEDRLTVSTHYDALPVIDSNLRIKNSKSSKSIQKYNGDFVHVGRVHEGDIVRLRNLGYDLLSPNRDEVRRALVYIQENEPHLMLVHGKPFSRQKVTWQ